MKRKINKLFPTPRHLLILSFLEALAWYEGRGLHYVFILRKHIEWFWQLRMSQRENQKIK